MAMTQSINQPTPIKEVFFLGAGASVSGGAPTFANFRDKAKDVLSEMLQRSELNENIRLLQDVLDQWNVDFSDYNIEEYYSAVEMDEQLHGVNEPITTEKIARFIALTIQKSIKVPNTPPYRSLAKYGGAETIIITTNWDILLEFSIIESQVRGPNDGFSIYYGNDGLIEPYNTTDQQSNGPHVLKLHGSLNWGFCKGCGKIYYFDKKMSGQLTSKMCPKCKIKLTLTIIPPTISKLGNAGQGGEKPPDVSFIWSEANKYLELCKKLYFIGYSFPETDVQMKIFISNALRKNKHLEEIIIVSNSKYGNSRVDFEERYSPILQKTKNNPKITFKYNGFEKFCEELPKN